MTGIVTWRVELDTLDWQRKVTVRLTLDGSDSVRYVLMTSSAAAPRILLHRKTDPLSHVDPAYYTVSMSARELGTRRQYGDWGFDDTLSFELADPMLPKNTALRGRLLLIGYHPVPSARDAAGRVVRRSASRDVDVTFAAAFDPRPAPTPRTMTRERQQRIMWSALEEFAERWAQGMVHRVSPDSTRVDTLARAYLNRRWSEAATVDSAAVRPDAFYVRMRGRFIPTTCVVASRMSAPQCKSR